MLISTRTSTEGYIAVTLNLQGEELRKLIASPAYVECSSKTQEVYDDIRFPPLEATIMMIKPL